jgi:hypothetical protein
MLVTRTIGDCPECGHKDSFGNVDVFGSNLVRGCGYCTYSERIPLPQIHKKVVYLDQFFFSHAFRGNEPRFVHAANRIKEIASAQLLAIPRSSLHEQETILWERHDELLEFIKATSRGARFEPAYRVEEVQLVNAFREWQQGNPPEYSIDERDALANDIHKWDGYFRIEVGLDLLDADVVRNSKRMSVDALTDIFPDWRKDATTFDEDVATENRMAARGYMDAYLTYAARVGSGDLDALFDSPVMSSVVESLMHLLPRKMTPEDRIQSCARFLNSEHFDNAPYQYLSSRLFAVLKSMVRNGAYTNPKKAKKRLAGFFLDVNHIATYAPYCDVIVVDQQMEDFVSHPKVSLEQVFGTKVFSLRSWNDLLSWLDDIESKISDEHREALIAVNAPK